MSRVSPGNHHLSVALLWTTLVGTIGFAAELPPPDAYAYGFAVETTDAADYYEIALPLAVYRSTADPRLRDLGVYDRQGRPVPRFVEPPVAAPEPAERRIEIRAFALPRDAPRSPEAIRLLLQTGRNGGFVALESAAADPPSTRPASYILDLRDLEAPLAAVELDWASRETSFIGQVRVDGSSDLQSWSLVGRGAVAQLTDGSAAITTDRVELSGRRFDYLRVRWSGLPEDWRLDGVAGILRDEVAPVDRRWLELAGRYDPDSGHLFETDAAPWVDRVELVLPEDNVVVRASLYVGSDDGRSWTRLHQGTFYRWRRDDASVSGPVVTIDGRRSRRWRLVVDKGSPEVALGLRLGWRSDTLAFVAQGEAPYTVAAGRAADAPEGFPQVAAFADSGVLSVIRQTGRGAPARLGRRLDLGGAVRLEIERTTPWTKILLWVLLVAGVALVGWMASRLLRQLDAADRAG